MGTHRMEIDEVEEDEDEEDEGHTLLGRGAKHDTPGRPPPQQRGSIVTFVLLWYTASTALIFINKWAFGVARIRFPLMVTAAHLAMKTVLAALTLCLQLGSLPTIKHTHTTWVAFACAGCATATDIALSNASFMYVTVTTYIIVKSSVPAWILCFSLCLGLVSWRPSLLAVVALLVSGICLGALPLDRWFISAAVQWPELRAMPDWAEIEIERGVWASLGLGGEAVGWTSGLQLLPPSTHTHTSADVTQKPLTKHEPGVARAVTSGAVDAAAPYDSPPPSVEAPAAVETAAAETAPAAGGAAGLVSVATGAATGDLAIGANAAAAWRGDLPPVQVPVPLLGDGRRLGMESRGAVSGAVLAGEHAAEAVQRQEHMVGVVMVLIAALCSGLRWATLQLLLQAPVDAQRGPREQLEPLSPLLVTLRTAPFGVALLLPLALVLEYDEMETFGRRAAAAGLSSVEMGTAVVDESTVQPQMAFGALLALLVGGGMLAFLMLLCELRVVQLASGLTLSVLGVLKEVLTVGASVILFGDTITTLKAAGLGLCVIGIGLYQRIQRSPDDCT